MLTGILTLVGTILTALLPTLGLLAQDYVERRRRERAEQTPSPHQVAVDRELVHDKPAFSVRLSGLLDATDRARPPE